MREILFKAKRIDNGEWVEGYLVKSNERILTSVIIKCIDSIFPEMWPIYEVDEKTICQYTGLTDKNGKKIWENDVCKITFGDGETTNGIIEYRENNCRFILYEVGDGDYGFTTNSVEVIGNIFDNPELLERGE